jgi:hypothetical protein
MTIELLKKIDITYDQFENVIVTALEGGSNYWYAIDVAEFKDKLPLPREPMSVRIAKGIWDNPELEINVYDCEHYDEDAEDNTILGQISLNNFKKALAKLNEESSWALDELLDDNLDADSADVIFQYIVLGELTYC